MKKNMDFTEILQSGKELTLRDKLEIVGRLSLPGILSQIAEILMQYIDAAMVGSLGAAASAAIGVVSTTTWLFGSLISSVIAGFSVQTAHAVGAGNDTKARYIFRQAIIVGGLFSFGLSILAVLIGQVLPQWLGADISIQPAAKAYFIAYGLFIPVRLMYNLASQMVQRAGNMKVPSVVVVVMCTLDVVFNFFMIFGTRTVTLGGHILKIPGAGLGVLGAQLGTSLSYAVCMIYMFYYAIVKSPRLAFRNDKERKWKPDPRTVREAVRIGLPMAFEQSALCLAQVVTTKIVAPLGTIAIAANSFGVTAESLCYMPGYGISGAATTLVGQSFGAERKELARSFSWLTTFCGIAVMSLCAVLMYFICPYVFAFLTPDTAVRSLGVQVLRIELLAEPMFAASIVATGALRGVGDTMVPGIMNLISIWGVRIVLSWLLTPTMGLMGAWIGMSAELNFRGVLFLIRLKRERWLKSVE